MATDLSRSDLRGRSLAGARLPFASLAGSDLRGVNLSGADLRGADLSHVRTGMNRRWTALLVAGSLAVSVGVGALSGVVGRLLQTFIASDEPRRRIVGVVVAVSLLTYLAVGIWKGLLVATRLVLPIAATFALVAGIVVIVSGAGTGVGALVALAFLAQTASIVILSVLARALAGTAGGVFFVIVAVAGALTGRALGGGATALAVAIGAMIMARQSRGRQDAFPLLGRITAAIVCRGGTRLRDADLTGASLTGARLVGCDLRGTTLTNARLDVAEFRLCRIDSSANPRPAEPRRTRRHGNRPPGGESLATRRSPMTSP